MRKLSLLLVVFSLGLFTLGCTETETDVTPSTPDAPVIEDDMGETDMGATDIDVEAPDADVTTPDADVTAPDVDVTAPDAAAPDAAAPDAAAPAPEEGAAPAEGQ